MNWENWTLDFMIKNYEKKNKKEKEENIWKRKSGKKDMSHSQMLGKFEYGGGPIFKVVLEC